MKLNGKKNLETELEPNLESNQKRFKTDTDLFSVPTTEEAYALKNTENLYQSNLLKLQVTY